MAWGVLMAARLALALLPPISLAPELRVRRADRAKHWVANLAMPQPARMTLLRTFDATTLDRAAAAAALAELGSTMAGHLDSASQHELSDIIQWLSESAGAESLPAAVQAIA
jgi:hypothetical protein